MLLKSDLVLAQMNVGISAGENVKSVRSSEQETKGRKAGEESVREGQEEDEQT